MPKAAVSKQTAESSKKKRTRNDFETEGEGSNSAVKDSKRQNTARTPSRAKKSSSRSKVASTDVNEPLVATNLTVLVGSQKSSAVDAGDDINGETFNALPPNGKIPTSARKSRSPKEEGENGHVSTPVVEDNAPLLDDISPEKPTSRPSRKKWEFLLLWPVIMLAIVTGGWILDRHSMQLAMGELKSAFRNYQALHPDVDAQDAYYISELERQVRDWKRAAAEKDAELTVLREECGNSEPASS